MPDSPKLHIKEEFARFFEEPSRDKLRELLKQQSGEYDCLEFKEAWPQTTDLARHILAFANSGSGCIVIGVAERDDKTFDVKGLEALTDKTETENSVKKYLPDSVQFAIHDFEYTESEYATIREKKFQTLLVAYDPKVIPVLSQADGSSLKRNRIYVRSGSSSTEANHNQVQAIIQKRLAAETMPVKGRELANHIAELEALYEHNISEFVFKTRISAFDSKGDFYRFIRQAIAKKQQMIIRLLEK